MRKIRKGPFSRPPFQKGHLSPDDVTPGSVGSPDYRFGMHAEATHNAEAIKSVIFRSAVGVAAALTGAVPALVFAPQQAYADVNPSFVTAPLNGSTKPAVPQFVSAPQQVDLTVQGQIFRPVSTTQGPTVRQHQGGPLQVDLTQQGIIFKPGPARQGRVPPHRLAAPQLVDLTVPAQIFETLTTQQGAVPKHVFGVSQDDTTQIQPVVTPASFQPAAPITPNPIAGFFFVPGQDEDRETRVIWPAQVSGATPFIPPLVFAAPEQVDLSLQAVVTPAAITPPVISYAFRQIYAVPQEDTTQVPAQIFPSVSLQPLVFGPVPALVTNANVPQFNPWQTPAIIRTPLEFGTPPAAPTRKLLIDLETGRLYYQIGTSIYIFPLT